MTERVLIYGSRTWYDPLPIQEFVNRLPPMTVVIHGGNKHWEKSLGQYIGADHFADQAARARGLAVEVHPADWNRYGLAAGPIRNQEMADSKPDRAQGFRMPGRSKGTDDMTRCLIAAGIPHEVYGPDGVLISEQTP